MKFRYPNSALKVMSCKVRQLWSEGNVFTKFRNSAVEGYVKVPLSQTALEVMSWQSSASTIRLRRECLAKVRFRNHAVEGSVFTKFCFRNSALDVIWQSSASATPLRRESLQEVPRFRCYGKCLHEVPQFRCYGERLYKFPLPQLHSEGNIFMKFRFHNSVPFEGMSSPSSPSEIPPGIMSSRSSASAIPLSG